jgi:hypothetical protein
MSDENLGLKPFFEGMILQPKNILDQNIFDENSWFKPIPEKLILKL